jgi:hypothetical protein
MLKGAGERVRDWTATRTETRYGCFLPDLTGLGTISDVRTPEASAKARKLSRAKPFPRLAFFNVAKVTRWGQKALKSIARRAFQPIYCRTHEHSIQNVPS